MKKLNSLVANEPLYSAYTVAGMDAMQKAMNVASSYQKAMESIAGGEAMQRAMNVASSYQRAMESLAGGEAMQKAMNVASSYQKAMESIAGGEAMQRAMNVASSYQRAMESLADGEAIQKAMNVASSYQKVMESIAGGEAMQRAMGAATAYQHAIAEIMNKSSFRNAFDAFAEPSNLLATFDFIARTKNNIFVGGLSETKFVDENLERQLQEIGKAEDSDSFVRAFSKLPPVIQIILVSIMMHFFLPVAQNVIANLVTPHVEKLISDPAIPEKEKVKKIKSFDLNELDINNLRFVTTGHLLLRESPNTKSKIKDELRFGQVVTVINKQRNWMEISYAYEDGNIMRGWVFSRYTAKFQK